MPFGKYKGWKLVDLPDDYLHFLLALPDLREPLRSALESEDDRRTWGGNQSTTTPKLDAPDRSLAKDLITAGYRALAHRMHPDVGGTTKGMQQLNKITDALRKLVGE